VFQAWRFVDQLSAKRGAQLNLSLLASLLTSLVAFALFALTNTPPTEKAFNRALRAMTSFSNKYNKNQGTKYCSDLSIPSVVIKGLADHKVSLGAPLCPCRFYEDKEKEVKKGYWNCPCVPMREKGECHCMLFLPEDNSFAGTEDSITEEEVSE